jgi:hypothetical protein
VFQETIVLDLDVDLDLVLDLYLDLDKEPGRSCGCPALRS